MNNNSTGNEPESAPDVPALEDNTTNNKDIISYSEGILSIIIKQHPISQLSIGIGIGWAIGKIGRRVGNSVIFLLASGIIVMQLANHSGIVQVNWGRVGDTVNNMYQEQIQTIPVQSENIPSTHRLKRFWTAFKTNSYLNAGLVSGILLGISM